MFQSQAKATLRILFALIYCLAFPSFSAASGVEILAPTLTDPTAPRYALVIGNKTYENLADLDNSVNDAEAVSAKLRTLGFTVHLGRDLGVFDTTDMIDHFLNQIEPGSEVMVFYAGHGVEVDGSNYLIPTDIPLLSPDNSRQLRSRAINLTRLLLDLEASKATASLVVLDSCRENPFPANGTRSLGARRGMGDLGTPPEGLFIIYSAGANQLALDNLGPDDPNPNGLFTRHFLKLLDEPQLGIRQMMVRLRSDVRTDASSVNHLQTPAYYDQLLGEFQLNRTSQPKPQVASIPKMPEKEEISPQQITDPNAIAIRNSADEACFLETTRRFGESASAAGQDYNAFRRLFDQCLAAPKKSEGPAPVHECDLVAASPSDSSRPDGVPGIAREDMDAARALDLCSRAVIEHPGEARFLFQYGRALHQLDRQIEALATYTRAADAGSATAMIAIAEIYRQGEGVPRDYAAALAWYKKAAERGKSLAMVEIGLMYDRGEGVIASDAEEIAWYRKAAELGNSDAMANMGIMYRDGEGQAPDYAEALTWFRRSADLGNSRAMVNVGLMYDRGQGVEASDSEEIAWYRRAADLGNSSAMTNLGIMYRDGEGITADPNESLRWFRKAAELGNDEAMVQVGLFYDRGDAVPADDIEEMKWYRKAADLGSRAAMNNIGVMYREGEGVDTDYSEARKWFTKSADLGFGLGMYNLAHQYAFKDYGLQNPENAAMWMEKALRSGHDRALEEMSNSASDWPASFRRALQRRLKATGVYNGPVDGAFGRGTVSALNDIFGVDP